MVPPAYKVGGAHLDRNGPICSHDWFHPCQPFIMTVTMRMEARRCCLLADSCYLRREELHSERECGRTTVPSRVAVGVEANSWLSTFAVSLQDPRRAVGALLSSASRSRPGLERTNKGQLATSNKQVTRLRTSTPSHHPESSPRVQASKQPVALKEGALLLSTHTLDHRALSNAHRNRLVSNYQLIRDLVGC